MGFWKFCSNLSSFTERRDALINQVEIKYLNNLLLRASVSAAVKNLIATILQSASATSLVRPHVNDLMRDDVARGGVLSKATKGIKINKI